MKVSARVLERVSCIHVLILAGNINCLHQSNVQHLCVCVILCSIPLAERPTTDELEEFISEITMMKSVSRHPNVVALLGCCTIKQPLLMIMEFVGCGDLVSYRLGFNIYLFLRHNSKSL